MSDENSKQTRRNVLQKGAMVGGAFTLGGVALTGTAAADRWDRVIDLTGDVVNNPCTGETATVTSGTFRADIDTRTDQSGGTHLNLTFQLNAQLEGNDTGLLYSAAATLSRNLYVAADAMPKTETVSGNFTVTSQGSADNIRLKFLVHMTVDATGARVASIEMESMECI